MEPLPVWAVLSTMPRLSTGKLNALKRAFIEDAMVQGQAAQAVGVAMLRQFLQFGLPYIEIETANLDRHGN